MIDTTTPFRSFLFMSLLMLPFAGGIVVAEESDQAVRSAREERRDILLYGIDTQVIETLENIRDEQDDLLIDDVYAAFKLSKNPKIKVAAFDVFDALEYRSPLSDAIALIEEWEETDDALVIRAIEFAAFERNEEVADVLVPLVDSFTDAIAQAAIRAVGKTGSDHHAEALLGRFDDPQYQENRKSLIILALGDLASREAVDRLIEILDDPDEEMSWRRYACDALGKIGDDRAIPAIERALVHEDANLRAYAVSSIRYFDHDEVVPALIEGLKDSFWRVRVSAAEALGDRKAESALPILTFKARLDPELKVRDVAIRAIAEIGTGAAFETLRGFYEDKLFALSLRITCAEVLIRDDLEGSLDSVKRVLADELTERDSKLLERTGYYLSLAESPQLETVFSRFLDSGNLVIIIYGIRGAERNGFVSLRERIETLAEDGNNRSIQRAAIAALETL